MVLSVDLFKFHLMNLKGALQYALLLDSERNFP